MSSSMRDGAAPLVRSGGGEGRGHFTPDYLTIGPTGFTTLVEFDTVCHIKVNSV